MMEANYCGDGGVTSSPTTGGRPQNAPATGQMATPQNAPKRRTSSFGRFCQAAVLVARVSHAVTTLDPVGIVTAVASLQENDELLG
jgi:hypothetical protein